MSYVNQKCKYMNCVCIENMSHFNEKPGSHKINLKAEGWGLSIPLACVALQTGSIGHLWSAILAYECPYVVEIHDVIVCILEFILCGVYFSSLFLEFISIHSHLIKST